MADDNNAILERLTALAEEEYRAFQIKLVPNIPAERILGVRLPALRTLAKELYGSAEAEAFIRALPHGYQEESLLHALLINLERDLDTSVGLLNDFLPRVDNWAVCDTLRPKPFAKRRAELMELIPGWLGSSHVYTVRFGLLMLMTHFLDGDFTPEVPELALRAAKQHEGEDYYIDMMAAWFFATALAKQYEAALPYAAERRLPAKVHSMTVRKACESFRLTAEQKAELKALK